MITQPSSNDQVKASQRIVPLPVNVQDLPGNGFTLQSDTRILVDRAAEPVANILAGVLRSSTGYSLPVQAADKAPGSAVQSINISVAEQIAEFKDQPEAYSLRVTASGVEIKALTAQGAFNAVQSLRQLFPAFIESATPVNRTWTAPATNITDAPRTAYRSMMLDVARSFLTPAEVRKIIDQMAALKFSTLHMHLADDQGWRLQITNDGKEADDPIDYNRLTDVSGKTAITEWGYQNEPGRTGFYTQQEYRDLVGYAQSQFITVVPEIDTPGHTNAALHAIPQLNTGATQPRPGPDGVAPLNTTGAVGYSTLDANADITWKFMRQIYRQLAALTPGPYMHLGGDESKVTPSADYRKFVSKTAEIIRGYGKSPVGWNEYVAGGLQPGDLVQQWAGNEADTQAAVRQGAKLVASPASMTYLDLKYNNKTPIGLTWAGSGDFPKYYDWDPTTYLNKSNPLPESSIAGVEAPLWSETVRGVSQAEFLSFPRAAAVAEVGWTPAAKKNLQDFSKRLAMFGPRMTAAGTNFYDGPNAAWNWSMAGLGYRTSAGILPQTQTVGTLIAPGTKAANNGTSIAADRVDDSDGTAASAINGNLTVSIDWGDGTPATPGTLNSSQPRNALQASGAYAVQGTHRYLLPGVYQGSIIASDGSRAPFTATVTAR